MQRDDLQHRPTAPLPHVRPSVWTSGQGETMTTLYRMSGARVAIESCRELGVVLIANGTGVHAMPVGLLRRYPGLLFMVVRYRDEIMLTLDGLVE